MPKKHLLVPDSVGLHFHLFHLGMPFILGLKHMTPRNGLCTGFNYTPTAQLVMTALESSFITPKKRKTTHLTLHSVIFFAVCFPKCRLTPNSLQNLMSSAIIVSSLELPQESGLTEVRRYDGRDSGVRVGTSEC